MATYRPNHSSILDTPSGHIGPVIFYNWKGIDCVRSMPQHYHDARTPEQLQNRSKLSLLMAFQSSLKAAIRNGYQHTTHQTSELNEATRINFHTALTTQGATAHINYSSTYLSWGNLPGLSNLQYLVLNNQLLIHWDNLSSLNPHDQVHLALYNETRHTSQYHPHVATRHNQGATIPIPQSWQHDHIHAWIWLNTNPQTTTTQNTTQNTTPNTILQTLNPKNDNLQNNNYQTLTIKNVTQQNSTSQYLGALNIPHQPILTTPSYQSIPTTPSHQPTTTTPNHKPTTTTPSHQSTTTTPSHQSTTTTPNYTPVPLTPATPAPTQDSPAPKCYQTTPSLGSDSSLSPVSNTPKLPNPPPKYLFPPPEG